MIHLLPLATFTVPLFFVSHHKNTQIWSSHVLTRTFCCKTPEKTCRHEHEWNSIWVFWFREFKVYETKAINYRKQISMMASNDYRSIRLCVCMLDYSNELLSLSRVIDVKDNWHGIVVLFCYAMFIYLFFYFVLHPDNTTTTEVKCI